MVSHQVGLAAIELVGWAGLAVLLGWIAWGAEKRADHSGAGDGWGSLLTSGFFRVTAWVSGLVAGLIALVVIFVPIAALYNTVKTEPTPAALSRADAEGIVKRYYGQLDHFSYRQAWNNLGPEQQTADVGFGTWSRSLKRNYQMNLQSVTVTPLNRTSATVAVTLNRLDYDACNNKVWQTFSGTVMVKLVGNDPFVDGESLTKTAGPDPVTTIAACQTILSPPPTQTVASASGGGGGGNNCDPSYPDDCLEDGIGDYDCSSSYDAGDSDGPNVAYGPLTVEGDDPFRLDSNYDGIGCEEG